MSYYLNWSLLILGAITAGVQCTPFSNGYDGTSGSFGEKNMGGSVSRFEQEYGGGGFRRDFDEGHKEDIEQQSIKYHSLVNKALNTAKDADRFVGDSLKEQEKSPKNYPRVKRSALPLAPSEKNNNFRAPAQDSAGAPAAAPTADAVSGTQRLQGAAAPAAVAPRAAPLDSTARRPAVASAVKEVEISEQEAPAGLAARGGGGEDYDAGADAGGDAGGAGEEADAKTGGARGRGGGGGSNVSPDKIDEMIDLMNSLNQKFAKMIANWDDSADVSQVQLRANDSENEEGAGKDDMAAGGEAGAALKRRAGGKTRKSGAADDGAGGGDYENPEEGGGGEMAEDAGGSAAAKKAKQLPNIL